MKIYNSFEEYEKECAMNYDCAIWLSKFLTVAKPRREVTGEAIKQGFTKSQLRAARKILRVRLIRNAGDKREDYWAIFN